MMNRSSVTVVTQKQRPFFRRAGGGRHPGPWDSWIPGRPRPSPGVPGMTT